MTMTLQERRPTTGGTSDEKRFHGQRGSNPGARLARVFSLLPAFFCLVSPVAAKEAKPMATLKGEIVDAETGAALPARVYIRSSVGEWFFVRSASPQGSAVEYSKRNSPERVEMHTTLSAHPFVADLPLGRYTIQVERGKEYLSAEQTVDRSISTATPPVSRPMPMASIANRLPSQGRWGM